MPPRAPLKVGFSGLAKTITTLLALALVGLAGLVAVVAYGFAYGSQESVTSSIGDGVWHRDENGKLAPGPGAAQELDTIGWVGAIGGSLCSLMIVLFALYLALRVLRTAAWLSGSELNMRGALRKRSVDLATARVRTEKDPYRLIAGDVTLPLKSIADDQLLMLANAISNKRSRGGSSDEALATADRLRELARSPFS